MRISSSLFGLGLLIASTVGAKATAEDALIGLWATRIEFDRPVSGELVVRRTDIGWHGKVGEFDARAALNGLTVRLEFGGGCAVFEGHLTDDRSEIDGFWLSQPGQANGLRDPGAAGQPFASSLVLNRADKDHWKGGIPSFPEHFSLYLKIFKGDDGALLGAFRNPEANSRGGASRFLIRREGDDIAFGLSGETGDFDLKGQARLLHGPDRMRLFWPDLNGEIELHRADDEEAAVFYPRPPGETLYQYRKPADLGDGWRTARAKDVGFDEKALEEAVQAIVHTDPAERRAALIHSLLIARRGKLVLDEYFFGFDAKTPHDLRSAGKTFASVMLGAVMRKGVSISPETRLCDLVADMGPFAHPDAGKAKITLANLMTHTSGLACDDNDAASPGNEETMQNQTEEPNWWKYTLDLPMAHNPGETYAYCSAGMNLMGAALKTATGMPVPTLFERTIAWPLHFGRWYWNLMPTGEGYLGGGAYILPRDLLKLGQTYLDGGVWKRTRIVSANWVKESTTPKIEITPETTDLAPDRFANVYIGGADGFAWHLNPVHSRGRTFTAYTAAGNGGQQLIVVPEFDLVVVFTGGNYGQGNVWLRWRDDIVGGEIIPAIDPGSPEQNHQIACLHAQ